MDSGRLIYAADHDSQKTSACDDFKTFSMGTFFEHRVVNERYTHSGFDLDVHLQFFEKQKAMVLNPLKHNDLKMFKVIQSFFERCINSSKPWFFCSLKKFNGIYQ